MDEPQNFALRPYDREQWDVMFFIQGICEMFLIDERAGMPRNKMRFIIEGDDLRGENNVGVVIPAGVAHAIRSAEFAGSHHGLWHQHHVCDGKRRPHRAWRRDAGDAGRLGDAIGISPDPSGSGIRQRSCKDNGKS